MSRIFKFLALCVLLAACIWPAELDAQCAMCKEAAERSMDTDPRSMARSLNKGILYLMAVPYLLIAFIFRKQLFQVWKKVTARFNSGQVQRGQ